MKNNKRAIRRHHYRRLKKKRKYNWGHDDIHWPMEDSLMGFAANTPKPCSKTWCCGNPRELYGKPVSEIKDEQHIEGEIQDFYGGKSMKIVKGNLIKMAKEGKFDVIAHGCNCFCTMGSGIAKQIKDEFPKAYEADLDTISGDKSKLGYIGTAIIEEYNFDVANAYTQYRYGPGLHTDYKAVRSCMSLIKKWYAGKRIGLPQIGCGLGGGDWEIVRNIIEEELDGEDVTVVIYEG